MSTFVTGNLEKGTLQNGSVTLARLDTSRARGGAFAEASIHPALHGQPYEAFFSTHWQAMGSLGVTQLNLMTR